MDFRICLQCHCRCRDSEEAVRIYRNPYMLSLPGDFEGFVKSIHHVEWFIPPSFFMRKDGTIRQDWYNPTTNTPCSLHCIINKEAEIVECEYTTIKANADIIYKIFDEALPPESHCPFYTEHTVYDLSRDVTAGTN